MSDKLPTSPELEAVAAQLDGFARQLVWICLEPVPAPTETQLRSVQTFYPSENLLSVRRMLTEGRARVGPFLPGDVEAFGQVTFAPHGLLWHTESPNDAELIALGVEPHA